MVILGNFQALIRAIKEGKGGQKIKFWEVSFMDCPKAKCHLSPYLPLRPLEFI